MKKNDYEKLLSIAMSTGADFAEIYYENSTSKTYSFTDSKLDTIKTSNKKGIGIRIIKGKDYYYSSTNNLDMNNLVQTVGKLAKNISNEVKSTDIKLNDLEKFLHDIKIYHNDFPSNKKKEILLNIDKKIREKHKEICQVALRFVENSRSFVIANSNGKYVESDDYHTRYVGIIYAAQEDTKADEFISYGEAAGYEFLDNFDLETESLKAAKKATDKLKAEDFKGGEMPVIIAPGFGAVIFHEACGHGLEATSIAPNLSIFSGMLGKKIGSDKVTLIDEGAWIFKVALLLVE